MTAPSVRCPACGRRSWHPVDVAERYCQACRGWHDDLVRVADDIGRELARLSESPPPALDVPEFAAFDRVQAALERLLATLEADEARHG